MKSKKTMDKVAALRQRLQFSLNEGRDGLAVGVVRGALQKLSEMAPDDFADNALVWVARRNVLG